MIQATLIKALQHPGVFPHTVADFKVIETHLSWIILTGSFAYKIKKSVNLGFQDFTTLEKRKTYCEKEIELNRRLAPDLYISVCPITGTIDAPSMNVPGTPIEYAIQMHQFSQDQLLTNLVKNEQLTLAMLENLALQLATFHQHAERCNDALPFGSPDSVYAPMQENFSVLRSMPCSQPYHALISDIEAWSLSEFSKHQDLFRQRKEEGFIRACHGDLHLGNMALIHNNPAIFDCIEFNESFRWIDVMNDIGFLTMDLDHFSLPAFHAYFLNKYLEHTGDYQGLCTLRLYQSYRAMVRAKIMGFQSNKHDFEKFISLAEHYTHTIPPSLTITFGLSGSGKSYQSEALLMKTGAIRLRSDTLRNQVDVPLSEKYSPQTTQMIYAKLAELSEQLIKENYSVIIDATCLKKWQRELFFTLAARLNVTYHILACEAPLSTLKERIEMRPEKLSEATSVVLDWQAKEQEPLTEAEKQYLMGTF